MALTLDVTWDVNDHPDCASQYPRVRTVNPCGVSGARGSETPIGARDPAKR